MDEVRTRITGYVKIIDPTVEDGDFLDFIVADVVDRVLTYTSREQLILDWNEDVVDYPITDKTDVDETYYQFWKNYEGYPIPTVLEKPIARVVAQVYKTIENNVAGDSKEVSSISDNNQSITFTDEAEHYLSTKDDAEVFSSIRYLLDKFRIPTVVENT